MGYLHNEEFLYNNLADFAEVKKKIIQVLVVKLVCM